MSYKILIVDDEEAIRDLLSEHLGSLNYSVETAVDGVDALKKMGQGPYDLVLSDINMPRMKGFELLKITREKYPHIKRVLITAYNVEDYLELALEHDIGNIITKTSPFNFNDVEMVVKNLLTENFFGLEKHFNESITQKSLDLCDPNNIDETADTVLRNANLETRTNKLKLVLVELFTNAIFYGAKSEDSENKETWTRNFILTKDEAIQMNWAADSEKFGVSVIDRFGKLKKQDVLHWLSRQTKRDESGLPVGIFDKHGRGFFIARSYVDSLIINIKAGFRTEIICLCYYNQGRKGFKPLYINEI